MSTSIGSSLHASLLTPRKESFSQPMTRHTEITRTEEGFVSRTTFQGRDGKVVTRESTATYNPETLTLTRDVLTTGPEGKTMTRHGETTRTEEGFVSRTTVEGPDGEVITREGTSVRDPETGALTHDVLLTGPEGATVSRHSHTAFTDDGFVSQTMVQGPQGEITTRQGAGVWDAATQSWIMDMETTLVDAWT